jgi:hypothetical protein
MNNKQIKGPLRSRSAEDRGSVLHALRQKNLGLRPPKATSDSDLQGNEVSGPQGPSDHSSRERSSRSFCLKAAGRSFSLSPDPLFLRIADISIAVHSKDPEFKIKMDEDTKKFLVTQADPDVRVEAGWGDNSKISDGKKIFDSGVLWQLYSDDRSYRFHFTTTTLGPVPYKIARFNREFESGEVFFHHPYFPSEPPLYPLDYPLDEILIANILARGEGVEVHGCGVVDAQGKGHLFIGKSGAGKTTMARLWENEPGITVLSDDRIILRQVDNTIWMYGTPWHGEANLASPDRVPLTKVYFLSKGIKNELFPLRECDAAGRLLACSFPPFYSQQGLDFTLSFLEEIVRATPCYELKFLPDEEVLGFIL